MDEYAEAAAAAEGLVFHAPALVVMALVGVAIFGYIIAITADQNVVRQHKERSLAAWISDCKMSLSDCSWAWDQSPTLRKIYWERSKP